MSKRVNTRAFLKIDISMGDSESNKRKHPNTVSSDSRLELLDKVESFLVGVIFFLGHYIRTVWHILFQPGKIKYLNPDNEASQVPGSHIQPLTFLFTSLIFATLFFSKIILLIDDYGAIENIEIEIFQYLITVISDLNIDQILYVFTPFILVVAVIALLGSLLAKIWTTNTSYKLHLSLYSYIIGSVFFLIGLFLWISLIFGAELVAGVFTFLQTLLIYTPMLVVFLLLILLIYRFLILLKDLLSITWVKTLITASPVPLLIFLIYFILGMLGT